MVILESHSQTTPDSSRHVPRVIEHDSRVISTRYHGPCSCTPTYCLFTVKNVKTADSREKLCRSTPDASVSAQDAYWAPHTPTPTMRRLGSGRILHRVTREAVTHTTARPGCLSSITTAVRASRRPVMASARRSAGCVSTAWYHPMCVMPNSR